MLCEWGDPAGFAATTLRSRDLVAPLKYKTQVNITTQDYRLSHFFPNPKYILSPGISQQALILNLSPNP